MLKQAILGAIIEAFLVGVVFAKLVRTKQRAQAIGFSQFAIVCQQDGQLSLMFRVADRHTSRIIGARVRATLVSQTRTTREGHVVTLDQQPLRIYPSGEDSDLLLLWPTTIVHSITVESPLYGMNESEMTQAAFEIIVTLEGTTSSTDMSTQAMTSYLPTEILWGYRFDDMIGAKSDNGRPTVDHSLMDNIYPVRTTPEDDGSEEFIPDLS
jgi:potassium inwardly-rectifying channel subfamily J